MTEDLSKTIYLECKCTDFDHVVRVSLWDWQDSVPPEVQIEYRLNHHEGFWARIKTALTYVFGYKGETMVYHDILIDDTSMNNLYNLCKDYKLAKELYDLGPEKETT